MSTPACACARERVARALGAASRRACPPRRAPRRPRSVPGCAAKAGRREGRQRLAAAARAHPGRAVAVLAAAWLVVLGVRRAARAAACPTASRSPRSGRGPST